MGVTDIEAGGRVSLKKEASIYGETGDFLQVQSVISLVDCNWPIVIQGNKFQGNSGTKGTILVTADVSGDSPSKSK